MTAAQSFGSRLRRQRESRAVSLDEIAASTKVSKALFVGLERGDLSRWPTGVYCRAHVWGYATAVGLPPADVLAEFNEIFPDRCGEAPTPAAARPPDADRTLRLTFASVAQPTPQIRVRRAALAAGEVAVLLALAALVWLVTGADFGRTAAVVALLYYPITIAWSGETAASRVLAAVRHAAQRARQRRPAVTEPVPTFEGAALQPVGEAGALRLDAADPLGAAMVLNPRGQDGGAPQQEYLLH